MCIYYGGLIEDATTYSGMRQICSAPRNHLAKHYWERVEGADIPGRHCIRSKVTFPVINHGASEVNWRPQK